MNISLRTVALAVMAMGLAAGISACDDDGNGAAAPSSSVPAFGGAKSSTSAAQAGKLGKSVKGVDPCTWLKPADLPELNQQGSSAYTKPTKIGSPGDPSCAGYDFAIRVDTTRTATVDGDDTFDVKGYRASSTKMKDTCSVVMEVAKGETVMVQISTISKPQLDGCGVAKRGAEIVAGRLPS